MNEEQLKKLQELIQSFGFQLTKIEQGVTKFDNDFSKGTISLTYSSIINYTPKLKL